MPATLHLEHKVKLTDGATRSDATKVIPLIAISRPVLRTTLKHSDSGTGQAIWFLNWHLTPVGVVEGNARSSVGHPRPGAAAVVVDDTLSAGNESVTAILGQCAWRQC